MWGKVAALGFSLVLNHPFVDGNKRVGHAAMAVMLSLNGHELNAPMARQEELMLGLAAGEVGRGELRQFLSLNSRRKTQADDV